MADMADHERAPRPSPPAEAEAAGRPDQAAGYRVLEERPQAQAERRYKALMKARPGGPKPVQRAAAPNRTGLPDRLKAGVESLSGLAMDDVRVHYNSPKPAQLQALAFAQGSDIHVAPGEERHLPHEAWHVVQQKQGRVRATVQLKDGTPVNESAELEREADVMGAKAGSGGRTDAPDTPRLGSRAGAAVAQRVKMPLDLGGKAHDADYEHPWVKFASGSGGTCWLYLGKSIDYDARLKKFVVRDYIVPHVKTWLGGNMLLYRGVDATHPVYEQAKAGEAPPKPGATDEVPDFTSDNSTTKFIPFSTSREIAVMGAKNPSHENAAPAAPAANGQLGVVIRTIVGASSSIGLFDEGEVQVLKPPKGAATPVSGGSLHFNQRIDAAPLDAAAILDHLDERLGDPAWSQLGSGWFGSKVPAGIAAMRELLAKRDWKAVLNLAVQKHASTDADRHPQTKELYRMLDLLRQKAAAAGLM